MKFSDQTGTAIFDSDGVIVNLLQPAQGLNNEQRIGSNIWVFKINLNISITVGASDAIYKVLVFRWRYGIIDAVTPADVLESLDPLAFLKHHNVRNIAIILNRTSRVISDFDIKLHRVRKTYKFGKVMQYSDSGGSTGLYWTYHILFISDLAADLPTYEYTFRGRFTDK